MLGYMFRLPYSLFWSMTNKMQRCIILFIIVNALTCFELVFRSSSGAQICTSSIRYLSNLFAVTASVDELGIIHTSGNNKQFWQIADAACTFWAPDDELKNRSKHVRVLTVIKSIIQRCILLVMLKNPLTMHGPMNVKYHMVILMQSKHLKFHFMSFNLLFFYVIHTVIILTLLIWTNKNVLIL